MIEIKDVITDILRKHKVIDSGISDEIEQIVNVSAAQVFSERLNFANVAGQALQGILANPETGRENYQACAEIAINQAKALMKELERRSNYAGVTVH